MKEKISRNKISRHYKSFFGLENMGLGENDNLMIDWGESLVNDFCNQEAEKRIAEKMPTVDDAENAQLTYEHKQTDSLDRFSYIHCYRDFMAGIDWLCSRLTKPGDSQKTEGGGK